MNPHAATKNGGRRIKCYTTARYLRKTIIEVIALGRASRIPPLGLRYGKGRKNTARGFSFIPRMRQTKRKNTIPAGLCTVPYSSTWRGSSSVLAGSSMTALESVLPFSRYSTRVLHVSPHPRGRYILVIPISKAVNENPDSLPTFCFLHETTRKSERCVRKEYISLPYHSPPFLLPSSPLN